MYYDRRVPPELINLLLPAGPLGWLLPWLSTPAASVAGAHVQTRRNERGRSGGAIQLYLGRTSPLEVLARSKGRFQLHADLRYRALTPAMFGIDWDLTTLGQAAAALRDHCERATVEAAPSFVGGEGTVHAGLMRHYGHFADADVPFIALDSEAQLGFSRTPHREAFDATLPSLVGLPTTEKVPKKLDLVAVDVTGRVLLVEVKADASGLIRAAWQVAVHVARFRALLAENPAWISEVLRDVAAEKVRIGLLGRARLPTFTASAGVTPVIAAPDLNDGWAIAWRKQLAPVVATSHGLLTGLRLWRVAANGRVIEDVAA